MPSYQIKRRNEAGEQLDFIHAPTITEAASLYARRTFGARAFANRVTGTVSMSGVFQAYEQANRITEGGASSVGEPFHVS